ncbi:MAG TPA: MmcQ/YjbR family DNA-binding protein [Dehalococcoidia bacterium]|nr:MmcQ/YjbR family DNA-binding protein [Dehalococcoidia bacterium]
MTYDEVVQMALELPGVETSTSYGTPALKVRGKFMARLREPDVMVLKPIDDIEKQMLMETQPETFFITDHYRGYPTVLIRLSRIEPVQLTALLEQCWRQLAPKRLVALR